MYAYVSLEIYEALNAFFWKNEVGDLLWYKIQEMFPKLMTS
jgi:hypothetical protein